jgi:phage/plasmid-associated DNA primase
MQHTNEYTMAITTKTNTKTAVASGKQIIERNHCDKEKIPYLYFSCAQVSDTNGKIKKKVSGLPASWHTWSYEKCMEENKKDKAKHNTVSINLRNSGFCIIDIDDADAAEKVMDKYGYTHYTESCSKKLPHLWRRIPPEDAKCKNVKKDWGDICYTQAFETIGSELLIWDDDIPVYKSEVKRVKKKAKKIWIEKASMQYDPTKVSDYDRAILDLISVEYWEDYEVWFKLASAIVKEKQNILLADEYSKKAGNYGGLDDVISKTSNAATSEITWGTVMHYAKLSNPEEYQKIINTHNVKIDLSDMGIAEMLIKIKPDDFVFQDNILYYVNASNPFWKYDDDDHGVKHKIYVDLLDFYNEKLMRIQFKLNEINTQIADLERVNGNGNNNEKISNKHGLKDKIMEERDLIEKGVGHAKTNAKLSNYVQSLKQNLSQYTTRIMFDTLRPYVFCFANCNIDVRDKKYVEILKQDYITKRVEYDFIPATKEQCDELKEIIERILPDEENRRSYMSALWCGLVGIQFEKFVVATGGGRNGKGVINELFAALLSNVYFYTANVTCLTENQKSGANQEVANMDTKRMILASEPNDSLKLKLGNIKGITGCSTNTGRALYSKKTDVTMQNMTVLECNKIPGIEGQIDASAAERFMIIKFVAHFTNDKRKLETLENCFPLNTRYKTDEFKEEMKCVLFEYLLSFEFTDIYLPEVVKKRTHTYLVGCDDFLTWFNDNYEMTGNDADVVKIKDLYETFREGVMWDSIPKSDRRGKWSKQGVISAIQHNIELMTYFKARFQKNGVSCANCLIMYRKRDIPLDNL